MKVLLVTDKAGSAIHNLANATVKHNKHINCVVLSVHPKRPDPEQLKAFEELYKEVDIIDYHYWRTAQMLRERYPDAKKVPSILVHNNEAHVTEEDWRDYQHIVTRNKWQTDQLIEAGYKNVTKVEFGIDLDVFKYEPRPMKDKKIVLYVGRIGKWKGVREIQQACKDLGYMFWAVGNVAKAGYWAEMNKDNMTIMRNLSMEELAKIYQTATVYVCNSWDGIESGTQPILEAMASGLPVLTRNIGIVKDYGKDDYNMIIREGKMDDVGDLRERLKELVEDEGLRTRLRNKAWESVKGLCEQKMSISHSKVYHKVLYDTPLVSIVVPTFNRTANLVKILLSIAKSDYKNVEVIIANDGGDMSSELISEITLKSPFPIKYVNTGDTKQYHLAKARNLAAIEAIGDYLLFLDDRYELHTRAITTLMENANEYNKDGKAWFFGSKGTAQKSFIENFALIKRQDFMNAGMFCERMEWYGGLSNETRNRFNRQGFELVPVRNAIATVIHGTHSKSEKRAEIIKAKHTLWKMGLL